MTSLQLAATQTLDLHLSQTLEELLVLVMSRNYTQQPESSDDESKNRTVYSTTTERKREREREKSKRDRYIPE